MRSIVLTAAVAMASSVSAEPIKIHGYITAITSPQHFEIDDYRISRDDTLGFEVDRGDYPDLVFRPQDLQLGTELEVEGEFNNSTRELHATGIRVFVNDSVRVKRSAVVEHAATLQRDEGGWTGILHADAQIIRIDNHTRVVMKENQTNQIPPGFSITYEGRRNADGSISATRLEMFSNETGRGERKLWRESSGKVSSSGELVIAGTKYKLTPDAEAQSFLQRIGNKLVPAFYEQELSVGAERRLAFQFYLVEDADFNAHAFPNGTVVVNSGVLRVLTSEAQVAAVLGHEIAHTIQEHAIREIRSQKKTQSRGCTRGSEGYSRVLENQADRLGLEYMIAAGYDPREAAEVWKAVTRASTDEKSGELWKSENTTARRSYLISELRIRYPEMDFRSFLRNSDDFVTLAKRFGNTGVLEPVAQPVEAPAVAWQRPGYQPPATQPPAQANAQTADEKRYGGNAVNVNSDPPGADVVLGGVVVGKTPMVLPTGKAGIPFVLSVRKAGYVVWTGQMVCVPGRTTLRVELVPAH